VEPGLADERGRGVGRFGGEIGHLYRCASARCLTDYGAAETKALAAEWRRAWECR